jgi:uncharacterized protein YraI
MIVESIQKIRRIVAIAAVSLAPTALWAQNTVLTVTVESAEIYKAPTTASPIIGHSPRGTALVVTRELGSWVKISWPDAQDGVGYVHVTRGTVKHGDPEGVKPPEPAAAAAARIRVDAPGARRGSRRHAGGWRATGAAASGVCLALRRMSLAWAAV